jgi:hypothetical protein
MKPATLTDAKAFQISGGLGAKKQQQEQQQKQKLS